MADCSDLFFPTIISLPPLTTSPNNEKKDNETIIIDRLPLSAGPKYLASTTPETIPSTVVRLLIMKVSIKTFVIFLFLSIFCDLYANITSTLLSWDSFYSNIDILYIIFF